MAAFTFRGVDFHEVHPGSPREAWGLDNTRLTVKYKVDWAQRHAAKSALLGYSHRASQQDGAGNNYTYMQRQTPHPYPKSVARWLYARAVIDIEGIAPRGLDADGVAIFEEAFLTVVYEARPYEILEDNQINNPAYHGIPDESLGTRWLWVDEEEETQYLTMKFGKWVWADGPHTGQLAAVEAMKVLGRTRVTVHWFEVPWDAVPMAAARDLQGLVNSAVFLDFQIGTLLFRAPKRVITRMPDDAGTRGANVQYSMAFQPMGWNVAPDPLDGYTFHGIKNIITNLGPYKAGDFNTLLRPV